MRGCRSVRLLILSVLALTLLHAPAARASAPRTSSLSWVRLAGADSCVATQELARDVETLLGRTVFVSASAADVSVEGRIEPKHGGFHAVISIRDEKGALLGTREIDGHAPCSSMREELALIIAVLIDPDAMNHPPAPQPAPTPAPAPPPAPTPTPAPEPPRAPPPKPRWHLDGGASLAGELGLLPHATLGVHVDALLTPPGWIPLEGYGALFPRDSTSQGAGHAGFTLAMVGGGLCPLHFLGERVLLYGCASGIAGILWIDGNGTSTGPSAVLAAELEARLSVHVGGPFVARFGVEGILPILRDNDFYSPSGVTAVELYRMTVVAGTVDLGLGFFF
jgi:hypothetical protein